MPRTLLIDNYDSYVDVLAHVIAGVEGVAPIVVKNDDFAGVEALRNARAFSRVVIGPGPGTPTKDEDLGVSVELLGGGNGDGKGCEWAILGVCLGHQALIARSGGTCVKNPKGPAHGRVVGVKHNFKCILFDGVPSGGENGFVVTRYHSLATTACGAEFVERAWAEDDGTVMAIEHVELPRFGVQFHPESVCTAFGEVMIRNFLRACENAGFGNAALGVPRALGDADVSDEGAMRAVPVTTSTVRLVHDVVNVRERGVSSEDVFWSVFGGDDGTDCFWLDTADESKGRFSFMGGRGGKMWRRATFKLAHAPECRDHTAGDEKVRWRVGGVSCARRAPGTLTIEDASGTKTTSTLERGFVQWLDDELRRRDVSKTDASALPFDLHGGFVGYLGYEMRDECDSLPPTKDSPLPDAAMFLTDRFVAFDHLTGDAYIVGLYDESDGEGERLDAEAWIVLKKSSIESLEPTSVRAMSDAFASASSAELLEKTGFSWRRTRDEYISDIEASQEAIVNGDTYEVCLTNMLHRSRSTPGDRAAALRELYSELRRSNAAPYASYLSFTIDENSPPLTVLCCSPERFLRHTQDGALEAKPIKGTTARAHPLGGDADRAAATWLENNAKDRAENLMIVDLLRNDLARVSDVGSVEVPGLMKIESYATVHQLVSTVRSRRRSDVSQMDVVRSTYPGGSMTGAPKIRTMEIIDALETGPRMVYSGSIGFFSFSSAFDLNIVIRSVVARGDDRWIGAGGAITILSDPEEEWREIELKSAALLRAVARVETKH